MVFGPTGECIMIKQVMNGNVLVLMTEVVLKKLMIMAFL